MLQTEVKYELISSLNGFWLVWELEGIKVKYPTKNSFATVTSACYEWDFYLEMLLPNAKNVVVIDETNRILKKLK